MTEDGTCFKQIESDEIKKLVEMIFGIKLETTIGIGAVFYYHEEYEKVYAERFEQEYGYLRKRVIEVIHKFLDCGILEHGMARIYCKECGFDFFMAFSCKTRFMCPSCTQKRKQIWTDWINHQVLKNISHRHWVFTITEVLRRLFYR